MSEKIYGAERRDYILKALIDSGDPITGSDLASRTNVSRQVIVQDISLLKAKNHPIMATAQGYLYLNPNQKERASRTIAVKHETEQTEKELNIIVDHGAMIRNVIVEHPIYGELTASLMFKSRKDVSEFLHRLNQTGANLLSYLTGGVHLHTIEASDEKTLDEVCQALESEGFLL